MIESPSKHLNDIGLHVRQVWNDWFARVSEASIRRELEQETGDIENIRCIGDEGDPDYLIELVNQGWPVIMFDVDGKGFYAIPVSIQAKRSMKH